MSDQVDNTQVVVADAFDVSTLGREVFGHMAALFTAIKQAAGEHTQAHALAKIGMYLAQDLGNMFDVEAERLGEALERFRKTRGALCP